MFVGDFVWFVCDSVDCYMVFVVYVSEEFDACFFSCCDYLRVYDVNYGVWVCVGDIDLIDWVLVRVDEVYVYCGYCYFYTDLFTLFCFEVWFVLLGYCFILVLEFVLLGVFCVELCFFDVCEVWIGVDW